MPMNSDSPVTSRKAVILGRLAPDGALDMGELH